MDIDRNEVIVGQPIKLVRDILKRLDDGHALLEFFMGEINASIARDAYQRQCARHAPWRVRDGYKHWNQYIKPGLEKDAEALVAEMIKRGWLELAEKRKDDEYQGPRYKTTMAGDRLATVRWLKRLPRAKAEQIVAELIERTRAINANPELLMWVDRVYAFGSYITDASDLGDIDVVAVLSRRDEGMTGEQWVKASKARARASGKHIRFPYNMFYGETEVKLMLKSRNRYLSFHEERELAELNLTTRIVYERAAT